MSRLLLLAASLATVAATTGSARGHDRRVSYSVWTLTSDPDGGVGAAVRLKLRALDHNAIQATLNSSDPAVLAEYVTTKLTLWRGETRCAPDGPGVRQLGGDPAWVRLAWTVRCEATGGGELVMQSELLLQAIGSHLHMARVRDPNGSRELLLWQGQRRVALLEDGGGDRGATTASAADYLTLGVTHILGGWDHLVFLFTLLLIAVRLRDVALAVTGFTLGHSITLALAATGVAAPAAPVVESLVGLTIAWAAAENVWLAGDRRDRAIPIAVVLGTAGAGVAGLFVGAVPGQVLLGAALAVGCYLALAARASRPVRSRWHVATVFGLVHGFAFASVLGAHGLSGGELVAPLVAFNAGVEVGQLAVVAVAWPLWRWLCRAAGDVRPVQAGSALAMALGVFWFLTRAF